MKSKITASALGAMLAAALVTTGCDSKEEPAKAPEKAAAATAKPAKKKADDSAKAGSSDKPVAATDTSAKADHKKDGKAGSCGAGSCG